MKKSFKCNSTFMAMVVTTSLAAIPFSQASEESFELKCGDETQMVKKLTVNIGNTEALKDGCVINQIPNANIGVFCSGSKGLEVSDTRGHDNSRRTSEYSSHRMSIGSDGGQVAQSRILLNMVNNELVITLDAEYNDSEFASQQKVYIPQDRTDINCDILPFNWGSGGGDC